MADTTTEMLVTQTSVSQTDNHATASSSSSSAQSSSVRSCTACQVTATPVWRRDKTTGECICNRCYSARLPNTIKRPRNFEQQIKAAIKLEAKSSAPHVRDVGTPRDSTSDDRRLPARNGRQIKQEEVALIQKLEDEATLVEPFSEAGPVDFGVITGILSKMKEWIVQHHRRKPDIGNSCCDCIKEHFEQSRRSLASIASEPYWDFAKMKDDFRQPKPLLLSALTWFRGFWMVMKGLEPAPVEEVEVTEPAFEKATRRYVRRAPYGSRKRVKTEQQIIDDPKDIATDTEYEDVDLNAFPAAILAVNSGNSKMDGRYKRMYAPSRGRPCYVLTGGKHPMYLFWNASWKIGLKLGVKQSFAYTRDVGTRGPPTEPYPQPWMVFRKVPCDEEGAEKKCVPCARLSLRILEDRSELASCVIERGRDAAPASLTTSCRADQAASDEEADANIDTSDSEGATSSGSSNESHGDPARGPGVKREPKDLLASHNSASAMQAPKLPAQAGSDQKKAKEFETRLRALLVKLDPEAQQRKIDSTRENIKKKGNSFMEVTGFTPATLDVFYAGLLKDFGVKAAEALERAAASHRAVAATNIAVPGTPPLVEEEVGEPITMPHRTEKPACSSMRSGDRSRDKSKRITFIENSSNDKVPPGGPEITGTEAACVASDASNVDSYKGYGDILWYTAPGALVFCDTCDKQVPQCMGQLLGSPGKSQFAQSQFVCGECAEC